MTATHSLPVSRADARHQAARARTTAELVAAAVEELQAEPADAVVIDRLIDHLHVPQSTAARLVFLLPIAFGRADALHLPLTFPPHYLLVDPRSGRHTAIPFVAEPEFREAARLAGRWLRAAGRDRGFLAIAARSPEWPDLAPAIENPALALETELGEPVAAGDEDFSAAPAQLRRRRASTQATAPRRWWQRFGGGGR